LTTGLLLAHGGVGGAIIEIAIVLTILAIFLAVWRRERSTSQAQDQTTKGAQ
jgi:hypothetical protein